MADRVVDEERMLGIKHSKRCELGGQPPNEVGVQTPTDWGVKNDYFKHSMKIWR